MERGFFLKIHVVDETRVNLKQHTILALCTVKDIMNKNQEVEKIPVTHDLVHWYLSIQYMQLALNICHCSG